MSHQGRPRLLTGDSAVVEPAPAQQARKPDRFRVLMYDDDVIPMDFVEQVLESFFQMSKEQASKTLLEVHHRGIAVCGINLFEVAESKVSEVTAYAKARKQPLQVSLEKA